MTLALRADHLITGAGPVHSPGWIVFRDGVIDALGGGDPPVGVACQTTAPGSLIMPGLVSAHCHLPLGGLRGCADDRPFLDWLLRGLLPAIQQPGRDDAWWLAGARASARELLAGGVTMVGDNFLRSEGVDALRETGQRGVFFQEFFGSSHPDEDACIREAEVLASSLDARLGGFAWGYSPHTPWTCPPRVFRAIVARARADGRRLSYHLDESVEEHALFVDHGGPLAEHFRGRGTLQRYPQGLTPTQAMFELGALGPDVLVAHAVQVTEPDVALLARTGTHVVHCPRSNLKLAEGVAPVAALLAAGVPVSLGLDSAASNSRLDLFEEMRTALLLQRGVTRAIGAMTAGTVFRMATAAAAAALGFGDRAGILAPGRFADCVVLDVSHPRHAPVRDPLATVVYTCGPEDVRAVYIGGIERFRRDGR